jgi:hypothetical protein
MPESATTPRDPASGTAVGGAVDPAQVQRLTDVVTRLRRALRSSIRTEYPWESLPMAQVELLQTPWSRCGWASWRPASGWRPTR